MRTPHHRGLVWLESLIARVPEEKLREEFAVWKRAHVGVCEYQASTSGEAFVRANAAADDLLEARRATAKRALGDEVVRAAMCRTEWESPGFTRLPDQHEVFCVAVIKP